MNSQIGSYKSKRKGIMVKLRKKKYRVKSLPKKDMMMTVGNLKFYFENLYSIYSLINDLLIGILFIGGSLSNLLDGPPILGQTLFFIGSIALILRPLLKIIQNTHVYKKENENKNSEIEDKISKKTEDDE